MKGVEVKKILQREGYTLADIASQIGESPQNFAAMLAAKDVKTGTLERIADAINVNLYFFYSDEKWKNLAPRPDFPPVGDVVSLKNYSELVRENERLRMELDALKEVGQWAGLCSKHRVVYFRGSERFEDVLTKWQELTTHCARRTFVVNALRLGIPAEVIMKWTGHSDFKAMKPYVKIVDKLKESEMSKFDTFGENR